MSNRQQVMTRLHSRVKGAVEGGGTGLSILLSRDSISRMSASAPRWLPIRDDPIGFTGPLSAFDEALVRVGGMPDDVTRRESVTTLPPAGVTPEPVSLRDSPVRRSPTLGVTVREGGPCVGDRTGLPATGGVLERSGVTERRRGMSATGGGGLWDREWAGRASRGHPEACPAADSSSRRALDAAMTATASLKESRLGPAWPHPSPAAADACALIMGDAGWEAGGPL